jgi:hypothetical protein
MSLESRIGKLEAASDNNDAGCTCEPRFTIGTGQRAKDNMETYRTEETCEQCGRVRRTVHFTIAPGGNTDELGN